MYHGERFKSASHSQPAPPCSVSLSSPCAQPVFQALLFAHCLWHNPVFWEITFAPHTAQPVCAACLCKCIGSRPPSHGPFKFLLWQTDSLKRVIHTPWSRLSPTSLRAGTDKSAGLPNHTPLQGLVLCHVLTSPFGLHVPHGWLWASIVFMCFIMKGHLSSAEYDASDAKNMARIRTQTSQHYFGLQIWRLVWKHLVRGGGRSKIAGWCEGQSSAYVSHQSGSVTFYSGLCTVPLWVSIWHRVYLWSGAQQKPANAKCASADFSLTTCIHPKARSISMKCEQFSLHALTRKWNPDAPIHSSIFSLYLLILMFQYAQKKRKRLETLWNLKSIKTALISEWIQAAEGILYALPAFFTFIFCLLPPSCFILLWSSDR